MRRSVGVCLCTISSADSDVHDTELSYGIHLPLIHPRGKDTGIFGFLIPTHLTFNSAPQNIHTQTMSA